LQAPIGIAILSAGLLAGPAWAAVRDVPAVYPTIQAGIVAAAPGDTVLVAEGTYVENIDFLGKNIVVASRWIVDGDLEHIRATVIDGSSPADPDTASTVFFHSGEGPDAVLAGFTITGGAGTVWIDPAWPAYTWHGGGGVFAYMSSPTIRHNLIVHNTALDQPGIDGAQGGGVLAFRGDPVVRNNTILWNEAEYGGGVVFDYSDGLAANNLVCENECGATYGGGGFWVIGNGSESMVLENNTIVGNVSQFLGGAIYVWSAHVVARNNIVWNNSQSMGGPIRLRTGGTIDITYSDVQGGYTGTGNIDADPLFVDLASYMLDAGSPCVDAGDTTAACDDPEDPGDPGGALWPALGGLRNDMGAYGGPGCAELTAGVQTDVGGGPAPAATGILLYPNVPNPFNPLTTIRFDIPRPGRVSLSVRDVAGRMVVTLADGWRRSGGFTESWDGTDASGRPVPSGVYFARLEADDFAATRKMTLVR
jgi:hypothetical protein